MVAILLSGVNGDCDAESCERILTTRPGDSSAGGGAHLSLSPDASRMREGFE